MENKDENESCVLTQICITYSLIPIYRSYVKFDINFFQ